MKALGDEAQKEEQDLWLRKIGENEEISKKID